MKPIDNHENIFKYRFQKGETDQRILCVSEKEQKAYLPYFCSDLKEELNNHPDQFKTIQEVIDKKYIVPLEQFKNSSFSRFRETFQLVHEKEQKSILLALDMAIELMFHYEVNPIIIAACQTIQELDLYLDCIEQNELEDFDCFEIRFEIAPNLLEKKNNP